MNARPILLLFAVLAFCSPLAFAADDGLPGPAFDASRYRPLWENSPFAVASPVSVESAQYTLNGAADFDGVSYASLVDHNAQDEHFVVATGNPSHGLTLTKFERGTAPNSLFATFQTKGGVLRLTLDTTAVAVVPVPVVPQTTAMPTFMRHPGRPRIYYPTTHIPMPPQVVP